MNVKLIDRKNIDLEEKVSTTCLGLFERYTSKEDNKTKINYQKPF